MSIPAGNKSDVAVFEKKTLTTNVHGQQVITWAPDTTLAPLGRIWVEAERTNEQSARFATDYIAGITPATHRILWDDCVWTVISAVHDRRRSSLTIDSDFSAKIEVTHLLDVEREYIDGLPIVHD